MQIYFTLMQEAYFSAKVVSGMFNDEREKVAGRWMKLDNEKKD